MRAFLLLLAGILVPSAMAQATFDVATVRLSSGPVPFERDGEVQVSHGTLRMHDVTVSTCIKWAYNVQQAQIIAPRSMDEQHYDIVAKTEAGTTHERMRPMMQALLAERFGLRFHRDRKELNGYVLLVAPKGLKMTPSHDGDTEPFHENSAMGMVARNFTMVDLANYVSAPLGAPLLDETRLPGGYDFHIDFRPYVDQAADIHADPTIVLKRTFEGELGLTMERRRAIFDTMVVDHVAPPTPN